MVRSAPRLVRSAVLAFSGLLVACAGATGAPLERPAAVAPTPSAVAPAVTAPTSPPRVTASLSLTEAPKPNLCLSMPEKWLPVGAIVPRTGRAAKALQAAVQAQSAQVRAARDRSRANVGLGSKPYEASAAYEHAATDAAREIAKARAALRAELASKAPGQDRVALLLGLEILRSDPEDEAGNRLDALDHTFLCPPNDPHGYVRDGKNGTGDPDCSAAFAAKKPGEPLAAYLVDCVANRSVSATSPNIDALLVDAPAEAGALLHARSALALVAAKHWNEAAQSLRAALLAPERTHPNRGELARLLVAVESKRGDDAAALAAVPQALPPPIGSSFEALVFDLWVRQGAEPTGASPGADAFRMYASQIERARGRERVADSLERGLSADSWAGRMLHPPLADKSNPSKLTAAMMDAVEASALADRASLFVGTGSPGERILRSIGRACVSRAARGEAHGTFTEASNDPMGTCIRDAMTRTLPGVSYALGVTGHVKPLLE